MCQGFALLQESKPRLLLLHTLPGEIESNIAAIKQQHALPYTVGLTRLPVDRSCGAPAAGLFPSAEGPGGSCGQQQPWQASRACWPLHGLPGDAVLPESSDAAVAQHVHRRLRVGFCTVPRQCDCSQRYVYD